MRNTSRQTDCDYQSEPGGEFYEGIDEAGNRRILAEPIRGMGTSRSGDQNQNLVSGARNQGAEILLLAEADQGTGEEQL